MKKIIISSLIAISTVGIIGCGSVAKKEVETKPVEKETEVVKVEETPIKSNNENQQPMLGKYKVKVSPIKGFESKNKKLTFENGKGGIYSYEIREGVTQHAIQSDLDQFKMELDNVNFGYLDDDIIYAYGLDKQNFDLKAYKKVGTSASVSDYLLVWAKGFDINKDVIEDLLSDDHIDLEK